MPCHGFAPFHWFDVRSDRGVDTPVGKRFGDVNSPHTFAAFEIGQGAGDAHHPVIAPRREFHPVHRLGQEWLDAFVGHRDLIEQFAFGLGVGAHVAIERRIAVVLNVSGARHPKRDLGRAFGGRRQRQVGGGKLRHVDMEVDAVVERPGDARLIFAGAARHPRAGAVGIA